MNIFSLFSKKRSSASAKRQPAPRGFQNFILEPILTPSPFLGVDDTPDHLILDLQASPLPEVDFPDLAPDHLLDDLGTHGIAEVAIPDHQLEILPFIYSLDPAEVSLPNIDSLFASGIFTVTDKLYITVNSPVYGQGNDRLVLFDLKTHTSKVISNNLGMKDLYGLTMQNGKLVAYSRTGQQVTIDPNTGASFIGGTLPISSELRGVSLQLEDVPPPLPVPPVLPAPILPTAPLPGQKGVPEDAGKFRKTNVSKNGVVVHYYDNGYLIVQPSGEGFWYGRVQLYGLNRDVWDIAPISLTDPDGDDVALRAKLLNPGSFNSSFSVSRSGQIGGADDQNDYYKFTISSPSLVKLKLDGYPDGNKILLWNLLENSSDSGGSWDGNYTEISRILNPGTYHVQIYGSDDRQTAYNLQVSASNLEGRIFRGEYGEAYLIKNGKRWSVPFLKVNEYLNRSWDSLEAIRQDDLEKIPFGGEYQPSWTKAIANEYAATSNLLGSETGSIIPAGRSPQGTTGYFQRFQTGTIHWSAKSGAVALWYELQQVYNNNGGSSGWLGFPTRQEYDVVGGRRTDFEGGYLFFDGSTVKAYRSGEIPTVVSANRKPIINFPNFEMSYGTSFNLQTYADKLQIFDPDSDAIQAYEISVDPSRIDIEAWTLGDQPPGKFLIPADKFNTIKFYGSVLGSNSVVIRAFDGKEWSDPKDFSITVTPTSNSGGIGITLDNGGGGNNGSGNSTPIQIPQQPNNKDDNNYDPVDLITTTLPTFSISSSVELPIPNQFFWNNFGSSVLSMLNY